MKKSLMQWIHLRGSSSQDAAADPLTLTCPFWRLASLRCLICWGFVSFFAPTALQAADVKDSFPFFDKKFQAAIMFRHRARLIFEVTRSTLIELSLDDSPSQLTKESVYMIMHFIQEDFFSRDDKVIKSFSENVTPFIRPGAHLLGKTKQLTICFQLVDAASKPYPPPGPFYILNNPLGWTSLFGSVKKTHFLDQNGIPLRVCYKRKPRFIPLRFSEESLSFFKASAGGHYIWALQQKGFNTELLVMSIHTDFTISFNYKLLDSYVEKNVSPRLSSQRDHLYNRLNERLALRNVNLVTDGLPGNFFLIYLTRQYYNRAGYSNIWEMNLPLKSYPCFLFFVAKRKPLLFFKSRSKSPRLYFEEDKNANRLRIYLDKKDDPVFSPTDQGRKLLIDLPNDKPYLEEGYGRSPRKTLTSTQLTPWIFTEKQVGVLDRNPAKDHGGVMKNYTDLYKLQALLLDVFFRQTEAQGYLLDQIKKIILAYFPDLCLEHVVFDFPKATVAPAAISLTPSPPPKANPFWGK